MPGLLDKVSAAASREVERYDEHRFSVDTWVQDFLMPSLYSAAGVQTTMAGTTIRQVQASLPGYTAAVRECPPAFAAQMVRALVLSQARFVWRNLPSSPTPRRTFGASNPGGLPLLERPWPRGTTGQMVALMEWHEGLAGNAFVYRRSSTLLRVLRPDWVGVLWGSQQEPELAATALDGELIGYAYCNGGFGSGHALEVILPDEMCHWAPLPNPLTTGDGLGESWITAALRDMQGDIATTEHKLRFWSNAATPNMVVKGLLAANKEEFDDLVDMLEARHRGVGNAYRTLYLSGAADATVVGSSFKDMDMKAVQGAGETRITMLGRVPAPLLGISEGLAGSSLNAGNFGMARRIFGDGWVHPTLQDLSRALGTITTTPPSRSGVRDAELWFDTADIPLLREDAKDAADILFVQAQTIRHLTDGGYDPDTVTPAVLGGDLSTIKHTGMLSVQLQEPGATADAAPAPAVAPVPAKPKPKPPARAAGTPG